MRKFHPKAKRQQPRPLTEARRDRIAAVVAKRRAKINARDDSPYRTPPTGTPEQEQGNA